MNYFIYTSHHLPAVSLDVFYFKTLVSENYLNAQKNFKEFDCSWFIIGTTHRKGKIVERKRKETSYAQRKLFRRH